MYGLSTLAILRTTTTTEFYKKKQPFPRCGPPSFGAQREEIGQGVFPFPLIRSIAKWYGFGAVIVSCHDLPMSRHAFRFPRYALSIPKRQALPMLMYYV